MKNRINILFTFLFVFLLGSCELIIGPFLKDDKMEREVQPYRGTRLRFDGFYYSYHSSSDGLQFNVYFLYKNGTIKYMGIYPTTIQSILHRLIEVNNENKFNRKTANGAFWEVDSNTIEIQRWAPYNAYNRLYVEEIHFLSDTSFVTGKTWHIKNPEKSFFLPDTFYFRKSTFKPDSLFFEKGLDKKK